MPSTGISEINNFLYKMCNTFNLRDVGNTDEGRCGDLAVMSFCQNNPIRGQVSRCLTNERAQLSVQMYSVVYFKSVKRVCCCPHPRCIARCASYLFIYRKASKYLFIKLVQIHLSGWKEFALEFYYKQEEQFSLTVKCNNWLPFLFCGRVIILFF